jgi:protein SCO1
VLRTLLRESRPERAHRRQDRGPAGTGAAPDPGRPDDGGGPPPTVRGAAERPRRTQRSRAVALNRRAAPIVFLGIAGVAVVALLAVVLRPDTTAGGAGGRFRGSQPPPGIRAPDFRLRDQTGATVAMRALTEKAVAVTFLDTQCREACPIVAAQVARGLALLSPDVRGRAVALAITVDPDGDTPRSVRTFLRRHRAETAIRYLVGPLPELRPVWRAFHVLPSADSGDDDVHSVPVRIYAPGGEWVSTLHPGADLTPQNLAHDLRLALER